MQTVPIVTHVPGWDVTFIGLTHYGYIAYELRRTLPDGRRVSSKVCSFPLGVTAKELAANAERRVARLLARLDGEGRGRK